MRILLACGAGLSTSILMKKIEKYCADKGEELTINAVPINDVEGYQKDYDCVLVGPQVSYRIEELKQILSIPVEGIPSLDYAIGNAENVIKLAHKITGK